LEGTNYLRFCCFVWKACNQGHPYRHRFVIDLLDQGWTQADYLANYPALSHEDIPPALLTQRQYVFPGQGGRHHMVDSGHVIEQVCLKTGIRFTLHDLRRTFLTTAEKLALPYIVLKKLANHSSRSETTFGYIVVDVERLREPMEKISKHLFSLMSGQKSNGMNGAEHPDGIAEKET
jgi:integrase